MPKNIKDQLEILIKLQDIETAADEIARQLDRTPQKLAALDDRLMGFKQRIEDEADTLDRLKKEYREYERQAKMTLVSIENSRKKLNSVQNNREYQSSLKEIEDLEEKNSRFEDTMIQHLDKIDELEHHIEEVRAACERESEEIEKEKERVEFETRRENEKHDTLSTQREEVIRQVAPEILKTYTSVKRLSGAVAIVPAIASVCHGCNMNIPPQMYNELQRFDGIKFCPHCQRIIYWGDRKVPEKENSTPAEGLGSSVTSR